MLLSLSARHAVQDIQWSLGTCSIAWKGDGINLILRNTPSVLVRIAETCDTSRTVAPVRVESCLGRFDQLFFPCCTDSHCLLVFRVLPLRIVILACEAVDAESRCQLWSYDFNKH